MIVATDTRLSLSSIPDGNSNVKVHTTVNTPSPSQPKPPAFLQMVVGSQLSSVEFVQDYLQLHFDGPTLTLFVWPIVVLAERRVHFGEVGYRDALCSRIAHDISKVDIDMENERLIAFTFDDGTSITISLEERQGDETGYFTCSSNPGESLRDF
jgi:hypothetical protein